MAANGLYHGQDKTSLVGLQHELHHDAAQSAECASTYTPAETQVLMPDQQPALTDLNTPASVDTSVQYLEPVLRDLGLQQWQLQGGEAAATLNSLHEVVHLHQQLLSSREELQDELHRMRVEAKTADKKIQRLQDSNDHKAQELGDLQIKLRQLDCWYREEADRWTAERAEVFKKCGQFEQRHAQFQHELRRKDGEFERLQKQLAALLSSKDRAGSRDRSSGGAGTVSAGRLTVSSRLGTTTVASGKSSNASSSSSHRNESMNGRRASKAELDDVNKRRLEACEAEKTALELEIKTLRQTLRRVEREHLDLINATEHGRSSCGGHDGCCAVTAARPADPSAALESMKSKLQALQIRKQRILNQHSFTALSELQLHAESANERLLLMKLTEAAKILEEQEEALATALAAVATPET